MSVNSRKDLLRNKGRISVFDERAAVKDWVEIGVVDNVRVSHPTNPIEIKTPSGITIYKSIDLDAQVTFDLFHPGNLGAIELLYRGVVSLTNFDGSTTVAGEDATIRFSAVSEAHPIPGFNGDKTAVTVNSVKSADLATTYSYSGGTFTAKFHWVSSPFGTGDVVWGIKAASIANGELIGTAFGAGQTVTDMRRKWSGGSN
jgi:hypothetical protein